MMIKKIEAWQREDNGQIYASKESALSVALEEILERHCSPEDGFVTVQTVAIQLASNPAMRQQVKAILEDLS